MTDADPQEINMVYDLENPNITGGVLVTNIATFGKVVRHYAMKRGFEFANLKTDTCRFIAKCVGIGCPWRIHASNIYDGKTIEVLLLICFPLAHKYTLLSVVCST